AARDDVDPLLERELLEALDRVLGVRFFLDHQLDLSPEDAARRVDAVRRPTDAALARLADRRRDAARDDEHADLDGRRLGERRRRAEPTRGGRAAHQREEASPTRDHVRSRITREVTVESQNTKTPLPVVCVSKRRYASAA